MHENVNAKRRYVSRRRANGALQTRDAILNAAQRSFAEAGWTSTTMAGIASGAGVATETVYSVFGSKRAIVVELVRRAVRRADQTVPLLEQEAVREVFGAKDHRSQIAAFARDIADVLERVAPLMAVVREARSEAELAGLYAELHAARRRNLAAFVRALLDRGPLRSGLDQDGATAILWRLASPELYLLMREIEGCGQDDYVRWLSETLVTLLDVEGSDQRAS